MFVTTRIDESGILCIERQHAVQDLPCITLRVLGNNFYMDMKKGERAYKTLHWEQCGIRFRLNRVVAENEKIIYFLLTNTILPVPRAPGLLTIESVKYHALLAEKEFLLKLHQ